MGTDAVHLFLASSSPRRRELLEQVGIRYRRVEQSVDEALVIGEAPADYVSRLARAKAEAGLASLPLDVDKPVLGADTAVVCEGQILGKPEGRQQAEAMLAMLSGRTHQVLTAICLSSHRHTCSCVSISSVRFRELSAEEIRTYWNTGEPRGKAGAYAIQGQGALFVKHIEGSYSGIVGLPVFDTLQLLSEFGVSLKNILLDEL